MMMRPISLDTILNHPGEKSGYQDLTMRSDDVNIPKYHERSELNTEGGYYPNLSVKQSAALNELIELIEVSAIDFDQQEDSINYNKFT